ncbi:MAG TPA: LysR substrate-binding domain-containing protein [Thermoanaerobaculia bacterium]|nr:LysR substrate-binding domain-containing protein [Thermoanaerobaculia bacterium]
MRSESPMDGLDSLSIRDLRAVVTLAERLHFGKAAEDLCVAQPSLSAAVKKVEEVMGERLFERTSRHVALTPAGQRVVQRIRLVLEELAETARPGARKELLAGRFRLGLVPTIGPYYAPRFLAALRERYPRLELVLTEALTESLLQMLRQRSVDAAIVCLPTGERGLTETPLLRERFLLAVPSHHPLAATSEVSPGQLDSREILLMEQGHCLREQTLEACGATPDSAMSPAQAASVETLRHLVAAGNGCALIPEMAVATGMDCAGLVRYLPFREPAPGRTIGLVFHERCPRLDDAAELAGFLTELHQGPCRRSL